MSDQGGDATKVSDGDVEEGLRQRPGVQIPLNTQQLQGANSANIEPATAPEEVKQVKKAAVPLFAVATGTTLYLDFARQSRHGNPRIRNASIVFSALGLILSLCLTCAVYRSENRLRMHLKWAQIWICVVVFLLAFAVIISLFA